jgi:hypothetical protein
MKLSPQRSWSRSDSSFLRRRDGQLFFLPKGIFSRGYLVKSEEGEERLRRDYRRFCSPIQSWIFPLIFFGLIQISHHSFPISLCALIPVVLIALIFVMKSFRTKAFLKRNAEDLEPSSLRYPLKGYFRRLARNESWPWLIFSFVTYLIAVSALLAFAVKTLPDCWPRLLVFSLFAIFPAFLLWLIILKRRQENEEAMLDEEE